ncbi:MAG: glycerophosphodiester phosphodiesterase, partial [Planctomycetaceae bacterium]|nr:glycerophosphodiester phosphodiesterase [Planctomycetaceae bacterium]
MKTVCFCLALLLIPASLSAEEHQVFAHRGASGYLPEHSLPAKAMAYAQGADFLEQDVVLTKDDVPLVLHDTHLDGITDVARRFPGRKRKDGRYYAIDFTLDEIKQLNATQRFNRKTGKPVYTERFPLDGYTYQLHTLEEEIRFIQGLNMSTGRNVGLFTEIKKPSFHQAEGRDIAKAVFDVLTRYGYGTDKQSACWVQCFELNTLKRFRKEFGWKGNLMMIYSGGKPGPDGSDYDALA